MTDFSKESYGLVFEGGGARGAYQIGVWKAINEMNIKIDAVVGTSVGALNGALFAQQDYEKAMNIWSNIKYSHVINVEDEVMEQLANADWKNLSFQQITGQFYEIIKNRGLDITPLKTILETMLDEDKLRTSDIKFGLATFNLSEFKSCEIMIDDIPEGQVPGYLLASAYLPAFKSERIFGKLFLDGGFNNVAPVSMLVERGYKNIIAVYIQGLGVHKKYDNEGVNVIELSTDEDLGRILEFNSSRANYNINLGYYDAMRLFKGLDGNRYYVKHSKKEAYFLKKFLMMNMKQIEVPLLELGIKNRANYQSKERFVCEVLVPALASKLKIPKEKTYRDIYLRLIEELAELIEVDRFNIYSLNQMEDMIRSKLESFEIERLSDLLVNRPMSEIALALIE